MFQFAPAWIARRGLCSLARDLKNCGALFLNSPPMMVLRRRRSGPVVNQIAFLTTTTTTTTIIEPILDIEALQDHLQLLVPSIASSLSSQGYWTNYPHDIDSSTMSEANTSCGSQINKDVLPMDVVSAIRDQSTRLRSEGRFEQSWSERIDTDGTSQRFDKEGVFACEPDGRDYETAPDMLLYMSALISSLPSLLNQVYNHTNGNPSTVGGQQQQQQDVSAEDVPLNLSDQAFNAKLAVTSPGGSTYPLHIDNTLGVQGLPTDDTRKLTCILYLNPDYQVGDGGELRLLLLDQNCFDLTPIGGRMVLFWSDDIPHEVLACKPDLQQVVEDSDGDDPAATSKFYDRYALTIWIPDVDPRNIRSPHSRFESLRSDSFDGETWC